MRLLLCPRRMATWMPTSAWAPQRSSRALLGRGTVRSGLYPARDTRHASPGEPVGHLPVRLVDRSYVADFQTVKIFLLIQIPLVHHAAVVDVDVAAEH